MRIPACRTATILLGIASVFAALSVPAPLAATDFPHFDHMNMEARVDFLTVLVDTTEQAFRRAGQSDYADQVEKLFNTVEPGDSATLGMVELIRNVDRARVADLKNVLKDPKSSRIQVEDALFVTLEKNMMKLTSAEMNDVLDKMVNFQAKTYATFQAMSPADQRRTIDLDANLGFFTLMLYNDAEDEMAGKKAAPQDKEQSDMERQIINDEFLSPGEPGLAAVRQQIAEAYAKTPGDTRPGVIYTVLIYVLTEADNRIVAKIKAMDDGTYHLPAANSAPTGSQALAQLLKALQAASVPAPSASAPPPRAAAPAAAAPRAAPPPSAPAASVPDSSAAGDDPIGPGGFIKPPDTFVTLLCVQPSLVDQSWGQPATMSKMAYFQGAVGKYVLSIAKPDWQYWVLQSAYNSYDPSADADPAKLVRAVPPGNQTQIGTCPAQYRGYNVQVRPK